MVTDQVQRALIQVLECYRRSGITNTFRNPASDVTQGLIDCVDQLVAAQGNSETQPSVDVGPGNSPAPSQPSSPKAVAAVASPAIPTAPSQSTLIQDAPDPGRWTLPVLQIGEREESFRELNDAVKACRQCSNIVDFRQQTVFGAGKLDARVCFMGEAPGADEDRQGVPFVGRAGQLLTKIIQAMKLGREEVFILNALKCRPPQNRTPVPEEIQACRGFVQKQLEVIQPEYIVCLGAVAVRSLLQTDKSIGRLRGEFYQYRGAKVVVTYHPSYLLRNENAKRFVWEDMKMLMRDMGTLE